MLLKIVIGAIVLLLIELQGLHAGTLRGHVWKENGEPIVGATVSIDALNRYTKCDTLGHFEFRDVAAGNYIVRFSAVGFRTESQNIIIGDSASMVHVALMEQPLDVGTLTVTAAPRSAEALTTPQSVDVVTERELVQKRGQSLMQSLGDSPGLRVLSTGNSVAKPVIRGLSSQRVVVLNDGVRQEGQQWGDEHGPDLDPFDIQSVEIVRGAGSVLYGSDALGGVVNAIGQEYPSYTENASSIDGELSLNGFSVNEQLAGSARLFGALHKFRYAGLVSFRDADDVRTPERTLFNSGEEQFNTSMVAGLRDKWGSAKVKFQSFHQELQFHEDPLVESGATPFQDVAHKRVQAHLDVLFKLARVETKAGWQLNRRKEFEALEETVPAVDLRLQTTSFGIKVHSHQYGNFMGTVGSDVMIQQNRSLADEKLIPDFSLTDAAAYLFGQLLTEAWTLSAGLRGDLRSVKAQKTSGILDEPTDRRYSTIVWSAGSVWKFYEHYAFAASIGRGWRAPSPYELFADGPHEGANRYEIGNRNLTSEHSLNADVSFRVGASRVQAEITGYANKISDYIYISPTGLFDLASGEEVYRHAQSDARLVGTEFSLTAVPLSWLTIHAVADLVRGTNRADKTPLPLMPADRVSLELEFHPGDLWKLKAPYITVGYQGFADQTRVAFFETASTSYALATFGFGFDFSTGASLAFNIDNVFDKEYRDHLSRYRFYAPNPGRSFNLRLNVPISISRG